MTIELIGVLMFGIGCFAMFRDSSVIVYTFLCATLLGSAAAFILESLGRTNISPAHLLLGFLTLKLLSDPTVSQNSIRELAIDRPAFWLLLTTAYAVLSAYFMPRLFAGEVFIFPVREALTPSANPLAPAMSNVTQSIYLVADFVCFFVLSGYVQGRTGQQTLVNAAIACALLNLIFALLDLVTDATKTTELLAFIRNANYAVLNDGSIAGLKRIVGSFNEASSFGAVTLGYFAFTNALWMWGIRPRLTLTLSLLSVAALVFSTSTTAYVGLSAFLLIRYAGILVRAAHRPLTRQMTLFIVGVPIVLLILGIAVAMSVEASAYVSDFLDTTVLNKMATDSGVERSAWNRQALEVFFDTYGFGAGNGSLRASSFPLAVLGSLGIVGTTLFSIFFLRLFLQKERARHDPLSAAYRQAAKAACLAWLITMTISGTLTDIGLPFFVFAAIAGSSPLAVRGPALLSSEPLRAATF